MGITIKVTLLLLIELIIQAVGQSPCPQFFRYIHDEETNKIAGHIEIPDPPTGKTLHLKVELSIAAVLPSKYVGRLELAQSKEQSVRDVSAGRPLKYRIHFPLSRPLPQLTLLSFNGESYCTGARAIGQVVTSIVLEHTLFPPIAMPLSENLSNMIAPGPGFAEPKLPSPYVHFTSTQPANRPYPVTQVPGRVNVFLTPFDNDNNDISSDNGDNTYVPPPVVIANHAECGRSSWSPSGINLLIARGNITSPGQWPWVVAIFVVKLKFEFLCGGTLVSDRHVVTAAHCLRNRNGLNLPANTLLVSLGRYHLRNWHESGSKNQEVRSYKFHPAFRHGVTADSDLAILVLRQRVEYSQVIKPICMWKGSTNLAAVVGRSGYVVGWGRDERGDYYAEPRMAKVPIVSLADCHWSNANFVAFTSNRTFCAGLKDGSGPCNGDSGNGLVMRDSLTGRYLLRGVVSRSLEEDNVATCDLTQYVVYVDIAQYLDWIQQELASDSA